MVARQAFEAWLLADVYNLPLKMASRAKFIELFVLGRQRLEKTPYSTDAVFSRSCRNREERDFS